MHKKCSTCERTKPASDFYSGKSRCKKCELAQQQEYRDANRDKIRKRHAEYRATQSKEVLRERQNRWARNNRKHLSAKTRKWRQQNPLAMAAHNYVARMIAKGELIRPDECGKCGDDSVRIEASHDDYSKPEVVEWLCPRCHRIKDENPVMMGAISAGIKT